MQFNKANKCSRLLTVTVICFTLILSTMITTIPALAATVDNKVVFDNTGNGQDAIALTQERSFKVKLKVDMDKAALQAATDGNKISWTLSREKGMQDQQKFPYQFLGGPLNQWQTVKTAVQDKQTMFTNIQNSVVEDGGDVYLQLTFDCKSLFGYNGIDNRDRKLVRDTILDYTGEYVLECTIDDAVKGNTTVQVRPYDSFKTQSQIYDNLDMLATRANAAGIYAKVEEIGKTTENRPIKAIFLSAQESDLTDYQALTEEEETNPAEVKAKVDAGTLSYKVPVMYSNVHADEITGSDACMDFLETIISAAEGSGKVSYKTIASLTADGTQELKTEMAADGKVWSDLIKDEVTGVGYIQGNGTYEPSDPKHSSDAAVNLSEDEMKKYYNMADKELNVADVLNDVFFIVVPSENADGKTAYTRTNGNSFDLNRDNTYQTQSETQAMTQLIAKWNPVSFHEIHGFYTQFQVEPCTPTHEPNAEYDLFINMGLKQGENFGAAAISNNETINSFQMPMRDYLTVDGSGNKLWEPFDDMSTSYTPQYSFMHGCNGYTVENAYGSQEDVNAIKYGFVANANFVSENKKQFYENQLEFFRRGLENIDADTIRPYYVSQSDVSGAEANVFRKKYAENSNFFPEYYVIPIDSSVQQDTQSAKDMIEYLLRNDVRLKQLNKDVTVKGVTYKAGTVIVDMHQAKRNMANCALYSDIVITDWSDLYSEPLTAFSQLRGFDMDVITKVGAFNVADMDAISTVPAITTAVTGEGYATIISNNSLDAIKAVNNLLKSGKSIGFITEGNNKGDFVVATNDFSTVKDKYILEASSTSTLPTAKKISKAVKLYIPGKVNEFESINGSPYGLSNYSNRLNTNLGWDLFAYSKQLGFELTNSLESADVIVGNGALNSAEKTAVQNGKPYIGYNTKALKSVKDMGIDLGYTTGGIGIFDALTTVTYENPGNLITAKYESEKDNIMYGYGGSYITKVPDGAKVLIKTTSDYPIEGFMSASFIENYKNQVQAIEYEKDKYNITLFANSMTNKAHQQDDYRYVTNTIFSKMLGDTFTISKGNSESHHAKSGSTVPAAATSSYSVEKGTITNSGNSKGTITFSNDKANAGDKVTAKIGSNVGYKVGKIIVKDAKGNVIPYNNKDNGEITFDMPTSAVNINAEFTPTFGDKHATPAFSKAMASKQNVKLNGKDVGLQFYNVDGYNYVKFRDIASVLGNTSTKFSVKTGSGNSIIAVPGETYTPIGGEMEKSTDLSKTCVVSKWVINIDDIPRYLNVYNIGGNNYFMLRNLGELLDFQVDFDKGTNTALITAN